MLVEQQQQTAWLDSADPAAAGRAFAEQILSYDFGLATEKVNGRLLFDAWMSLNEALPGPQTFPSGEPDATWKRRAAAYDSFQLAFRERLIREGIEAVAFNFAAGNFSRPQDYLDWFPKTLAAYIYLGFHEYGWPGLQPSAVNPSAALEYRTCMAGIRPVTATGSVRSSPKPAWRGCTNIRIARRRCRLALPGRPNQPRVLSGVVELV